MTKNDKNDYTEGWENITTYDTPVSWDDMPWRYQNSSQLDGYPFLGTLTTYSGGGYVQSCSKANYSKMSIARDKHALVLPS